jgi:4-amino-4-deoxy-L-arabinose transferase-like glycosyltransferase
MPRPRELVSKYWGAIPIALAALLVAVRAFATTAPLDRLAPGTPDPRDPPGATVRTGSLDIARGGPVWIAFETDSQARLTIGERADHPPGQPNAGMYELAGRGMQKQRIVLPAGPVAIRLAGDARLLWLPVGRRGDEAYEYVPASSLSPEPPERATFSAPGTSILDGVIGLALLAIIAATSCLLARRRLRAVPRDMWIAIGAVLVVALVVRLIDLGGHGQTWDEDVNWSAGRDYITNVLSLDFRPSAWRWNLEHPPVMKYLAGVGAQLADGYGPARALSALWTALGCALLVPIGARLYKLRVGILAGAIAALLPPLVAHGQIVGHESPTVLWWSLGILLALGVHDALPEELSAAHRTIRIRMVAVGVAIGVAFASRFVGGLLGPMCLLIVVADAHPAWRRRVLIDAAWILPVVALVTLYVLWPRLWLHPFSALAESFAKLNRPHGTEPFLGAVVERPPPYYFLVYLFATAPLGVVLGVIAWIARSIRQRDRAALLTAAWLVIPLGVAASPVRQDGVRYIMPSVVALAMCAAAGIDWLARGRRIFQAVSAALVVYLSIVLVRIHPYYLDYFGEQVGGAGTVAAHDWFETAWWGEGADRAVEYVNEHAAPNAHVANCVRPNHLTWFRQDLWTPGAPDWIVRYSDFPCTIPPGFHPVYEVDAAGAVLAVVFSR